MYIDFSHEIVIIIRVGKVGAYASAAAECAGLSIW
jgi:hypothetical protein